MAQRVHDCPGCGEPVAVPDHYFDRLIACPHCQTPMDRRTGEAAGKANPPAPQPQFARAQQPPQQYPPGAQPGPYPYPGAQQGPQPYPGAQYAPPPRKGFPRWAIALIVFGVLGVAGFMGLVIYAVGSIDDAIGTPDRDEWIEYEDPDGMFTARFPRQPQKSSQTLDGIRVYETLSRTGDGVWEVSYFHLTQEYTYDFMDGMRHAADGYGVSITSTRPAEHMGLSGLYGELDDGWMKLMILRHGQTIWYIGCGHHMDFDYFIENVRLSEKALGIDPLTLRVVVDAPLYQGLKAPQEGLRVGASGGRPPHTVSMQGDTSHGLRLEHQTGSWYRLVGTPPDAGSFDATIQVEDVDGRTATEQIDLEVHPLPDPIADVQLQYRSGRERVTEDFANGGTLELEAGMPLDGNISLKSRVEGRDVVFDDDISSSDGQPDWMDVGVRDNAVVLYGTPPSTGQHEFSIDAVIRVSGDDGDSELRLPVNLNVLPLRQELQDRSLPSPKELTILADVGKNFTRNVRYDPGRPDGWGARRDWSLSGAWHAEGVTLPDGIRVEMLEELDGLFPVLQFGGVPETSGEWNLEIRATVRARFVTEPREIVQRVKLIVSPLPDNLVPEELNVASDQFHFHFETGRESSARAPKLHVQKPVRWSRDRTWAYTVDWETNDIELPAGLQFEMRESGDDGPPRIYIGGTPEEAGEWTFELKGTIKVKFIDKAYEIARDVKIIVE